MWWRREKRPGQGERAAVERLEPRILYSADIGPQLASAVIGPPAAEQRVIDTNMEFAAQSQHAEQNSPHEVVFVDARTPDYALLVQDIAAQSERELDVIMLDAARDGLEQISDALAGRENVAALHIIAHGSDGSMQLGPSAVTADSLQRNPLQVETWAKALTADADILLYGCDVASTAQGQLLADTLARLTGADVSASDDATGHASLGGDWNLEYATGLIEAHIALSQSAQELWGGVLATVTVTTTADLLDGNTSSIALLLANPGADGMISLREAVRATNATAGADTISLAAGTYTLTRIGASENAASTGDLDLTDALTINGAAADATFIDGGALDRVFEVRGASATMTGLTIRNGSTNDGAGILVNGSSSLTIRDSALSGNVATGDGGAIYLSGTLALERVTIDGNIASQGGGIYADSGSTATLSNVTISGNTAITNGGAILARGAINLTNATIASNTATIGAGGIHEAGTGAASVKNTILANNTGGNANAALTSLGNNIDSANTAALSGSGDQINTDPLLGPLQFNGGETKTHALLAGSPAINTAGFSGATALDQRGYTRDATPDIGAYEFGGSPPLGGSPPFAGFWVTTAGDVPSSGVKGLDSWVNGSVLQFGDPDFALEPGGSDGTLSFRFNMSQFAVDGDVNIDALHYVTRNITVGNTTTMDLLTGDVLFSPKQPEAAGFSSTNTITGVQDNDLLVFRPDTPGNYSSGTFYMLLHEATVSLANDWLDLGDIALVEQDTLVGDTVLPAGSFILVEGAAASRKDIQLFTPDGVGATTDGILQLLIDGSEAGVGSAFDGLELLEGALTAGGTTLSAGSILVSQDSGASISYLSVTTTELGSGVSAASLTLLLDGSAVGLNTLNEDIVALTLFPSAPTLTTFAAPVDTTAEDTEVEITLAELKAQGDEADVDGTVDAFVVKAVSTGTLKIGATAGAATAWAAGTNDTISATNNAYWTPANDVNGTLNAFTVVARDNNGTESATPVQTQVSVTAVNDAPTGADKTVATNEDTAYVFSAADFGFGDVDAGDSLSAVRIDSLPGVGTLKLSGVAVTAADVITAANIANLTFEPVLNGNGAGYASFTFSVRDQSNAFDAVPNTITVDVTALNDAPVADLNAGGAGQDVTVAFTEQTPVLIAPAGTLADVDSANLASLTATLAARPDGDAVESLALNAAATTAAGGLTVSYTAATGVLSITGSASLATYQTILQGIEYNNTSDAPNTGNRTVTVVANDGALPSVMATSTVTVAALNDAPVADLNAAGAGQDVTVAFTEQTPVLIAPAGTLADVDSANLASLTATLAARPDGNAVESLALNAAATTAAGGLTVSYTAATGVLSITGSASVATYQTILQGIEYNNTSDAPNTGNRSVTVVANDGALPSVMAASTVTVTAVNDAPVADLNAGGAGQDVTVAFTEQTPVLIAPAGTLADVDSANLASLTATLAARPDGNAVESLSLNAAATTAAGGLTVSYTAATGVLSITGSASLATYQTILQGIQYNNTSDAPNTGNRPVTVVANDGALPSVMATSTVTVTALNDAPVADLNAGGAGQDVTVAFTEQTPVLIAPAGTLADVDSANLASLTATLAARPDGNAVESLSLNAAATTAAGGLAVSYTAATGVLSITGSASVATYQTILQGIEYNNTSDAPTTSARSVTVLANDGALPSVTATSTVTVTAVNDAPTGADYTVTTSQDTAYVFSAADFGFGDVDAGDSLSAVRIDSLPGAGMLKLSGVAVSAADVITAANIPNLTFEPVLGESGLGYASFTFSVRDQSNAFDAVPNTITVDVGAMSARPVADLNAGGAGQDVTVAFTEQTPVLIAPAGTLADVDSANLASLTATLAARPDGNAVESLALNAAATTAAGGLTVSYTAATGVLSITGSASLATYQTILQGIEYNNTSDAPNTGNRSVTVVANDGALPSVMAASTVTVTALNDAPVADLNAGGAGQDVTVAFTEQTPVLIAPAGTLADVDSANLASLTATLAARPDGNAVESLALNGAAATAASGAGLTVSYTAATGVLSITGSATVATYQTILQGIEYNNTSDAPNTGNRTVTVVANDGALASATQSSTITVTAVNDAPVADLNAGGAGQDVTVAFTEQTPVLIAPVATLADVDSANLTSLTATLAARPDGNAVESLALNGAAATAASGAGLTVSYTAATGVLSITGSATVATYQTILQGIEYNNTSDAPNTGNRTVTVVANDGALPSVMATSTVTVAVVNDAPVLTGDLTATLAEGGSYTITGMDLGYSDPDDVDAGVSFTVSTLTNGTVQVGGLAVTTFTGTQLAAGAVSFVHNGGETTAASFKVAVEDGNEEVSTPVESTFNLTVTPVNDAPTASIGPIGYGVAEDDVPRALGGISVADVDAGSGEVAVTLSVGNGNLTLGSTAGLSFTGGANGTASMTFTATVSAANTALATVTYQPVPNFSGTDILSLSVDDQGNSGGGGPRTASDTASITVTALNDAPVADLNAAGAGQDVTVAFTEQTPVLIAPAGTLADVDSATLASLTATLAAWPDGNAVESLSLNAAATAAAGGLTVSYTAATGVLSITGSATAATYQTILQGIQYNNTSDAPTTTDRSVTVVANDGALASATRASTITVTALNDAPANAVPGAQSTNEDTALVFSAGNGNAVSIADDAGANPVQVTLTGTNGVITLAGTTGLVFSVGDGTADGAMTFTGTVSAINAALDGLSFAPSANFSGAASLSVTTNDLGNTGAGGALSDSDAVAITVNALNDAPTGADKTVTTDEDTAYAFSAADFGFSDVDAGDTLSAVRVDALPGAGTLKLSGVAVTATDVITAANIANLTFEPVLNGNGAGYASFTFSVRDQSNAFDAVPNTITVDVTALNDAPVADLNAGGAGQDVTVAFTEQTPVLIAPAGTLADVDSANLASLTATLAARPDGNAVESLALNAAATAAAGGLTVSYTAATGVLSITGSATAATYQTILQGIEYNNTSDAPNTGNRSVTVVTNDGALPSATQSSTITVTVVNDAPVLTGDLTATLAEGGSYTITGTDLGYSDPDDVDAGVSFTVSTLTNGTVQVGGLAATTFTGTQLAAGAVSFVHNGGETTAASFKVAVEDGNEEVSTPVESTFNLTVTPVNDAPTGADKTVTTSENTAYVFSAADFGFSDGDAGDSLSAVRIDSLPGAGTLKLSGVAVSATDVLSAASIPNLTFEPGLNDSGLGYASFTFSVRDQSNAFDAAPNTITVNVTALNHAPVNTVPGAQSVDEDTVLSIAGLSVNDVDGDLATTQLSVASGTLNVNLAGGASISAGGNGTGTLTLSGTQAQVNAALAALSYQGNLNFNGADVLTVLSIDSAGVPLSDTDTIALTVAAVNDAPVVGAGATLAYTQKGVSAVIDNTITLSDVDDTQFPGATATIAAPVAGDTLTFVDQNGITGVFAGGVLTLTGNATPADYEAALRSVTFSSSASDPSVNNTRPTRTITWTVTDANSATAAATSTVNLGGLAAPIGIVGMDPGLPGATTPAASPPSPVTPPAPAPGGTGTAPAAGAGGVRVTVETAGSGGGLASDPGGLLFDIAQRSQTLQSAGAPVGASQRGSTASGAASAVPTASALSADLDLEPLANAQSRASPVFVLEEFLRGGSRSAEQVEAVDRLRDGIDEQARQERVVNGAAAAVGTSLTVGYLLWLSRGGILLSSLLASLPAWSLLDPLPVLGRMRDDEDEVAEGDSAVPSADTAEDAADRPRETRSA